MSTAPQNSDPVTWYDDTDPQLPQPNYMTWSRLLSIYTAHGKTSDVITWLRKNEGVIWVRGRVSVRSQEWSALVTARALLEF